MEPWQGGGAPWCIGSVFPAPQLITGTAAVPLGPLLLDGVGLPQRVLSTGSPSLHFESSVPSVAEQKEEFLSFSGDAYVPEDLLEEHLEEDILLRKGLSAYGSQILGNRLQLVEVITRSVLAVAFAPGIQSRSGMCLSMLLLVVPDSLYGTVLYLCSNLFFSKYIEPLVATKQSNNSDSACVPRTVAVAEFKGPEVHGVVRFEQESSGRQECSIEVAIDGLAPGCHGWSVHEFGDLTRGPLSTGPAYTFPPSPNPGSVSEQGRNEQLGNLGSLLVDVNGHVQSTATHDRLVVADIIGRSVVLYEVNRDVVRVAAAVIARSARPSSLKPQLCNCDGSLLWQGKDANSC